MKEAWYRDAVSGKREISCKYVLTGTGARTSLRIWTYQYQSHKDVHIYVLFTSIVYVYDRIAKWDVIQYRRDEILFIIL